MEFWTLGVKHTDKTLSIADCYSHHHHLLNFIPSLSHQSMGRPKHIFYRWKIHVPWSDPLPGYI